MNFQTTHVDYPEPHLERTQKILKAHPEVKKLLGNTPSTALYVVAIVALQLSLAIILRDQAWWVIGLAAYTVGAVANHALWALIHDCTHNLAFKTSASNSWLQIIANLPIIFPSSISFRIYHIKHHLYQGDIERDADLARPFEARWIGNSAMRKALWLLFFPLSQLVRVPFLKGIQFFNAWVLLNWVVCVGAMSALAYFYGPMPLVYITLCSFFSIGLHPLGARWIQEHYIMVPNQETYSYYGPLNRVSFNVGFHNEHHDMMRVPWSRLPKLRAMAPEFYEPLYSHASWTRLLLKFIFDPKLSLSSRITRSPRTATRKNQAERHASLDAQVVATDLTPQTS